MLARARCLIKEALKLENVICQIGILRRDLYNIKLKLRQSNIKGETYRLIREVLFIVILAFFTN